MFTKVHIVVFAVAVLFCATGNAQFQMIAHLLGTCTETNENWTICGTLCEETCANPTGAGFLCPEPICLRYITGGCRCDPGYLRNTANNACVLQADCP